MVSKFDEKEVRKRCQYVTIIEIRSKHLLELLDKIKQLEEELEKERAKK